MAIIVGQEAPDFDVPTYLNGAFGNFKLSDNRGHWTLLFFYPGDFTFVWPTEIAAVAALHPKLKELDTRVIGISVDSVFVHLAWHDKELSKMVKGGVPYPLGSDSDGQLGRTYGVYDESTKVDIRGTFLIDPDGIVQAVEIYTPPLGRNFDETVRQLLALQYIRNSGGTEAAPAGWQPGGQMLKPAPDLVGNVCNVWKPQ